jgi:hypothetical protein
MSNTAIKAEKSITKTEFGFQRVVNQTTSQLISRKKLIDQDLSGFSSLFIDNFQLIKKDVIDFAFEKLRLKTIAELGCVWGVNGAYSRYISGKYSPSRIVMVDAIWNEFAMAECTKYPCIETIDGDFCNTETIGKVGKIDAVIFFDLLLHLVNPDWNSVLRMYSKYTSCFMIVNPQYFGTDTTIRLWDLDYDTYFQSVPHDPTQKSYARTIANPYEYDEKQKKILRDVFYVWQWGIKNHDLIDLMDRLGFESIFLKRGNIAYGKNRMFNDYGFIFVKRSDMPRLLI